MAPLLRVENVTVCYNGTPVVTDVSFDLNEGEILGVVGESGSGKSTLIRAAMGLLGSAGMVTRGDILYRGENLTDMPEKRLCDLRGKEISMVFQDCKAALCPVRTVGAQIHEAMCAHQSVSRRQSDAAAAEIMRKIGLEDVERILNSYPFELSGGMNQRVGICMAMLLRPKLLLADEPTGAVDTKTAAHILDLFKRLNRETGITVVIVTHDRLISKHVDRVVAIRDGRTSSEFLIRADYAKRIGELDSLSRMDDAETHDEYAVMDKAGRLQIPREYLEQLGLSGKNKVRVDLEEGRIVLTPPSLDGEDKDKETDSGEKDTDNNKDSE